MGDFSDIAGEVGAQLKQTMRHTAKTMIGEAKKVGKSTGSHITGMGATGGASQENRAIEEARKKQAQRHYSFSPLGELKRFGSSFGSQISGGRMSADDISQMAQRSEYLDKQDADAVREKILQIYREYEDKRKEQRQKEEEERIKLQEKKGQSVEEARFKTRRETNSAVAKTRAEIGKNYGAE